jgi:hypothetical protein
MPLASSRLPTDKVEEKSTVLLQRTSSMNRLSLPHTAPSSTHVDVIKVLRRQSSRLKRTNSFSSKENSQPNEKKLVEKNSVDDTIKSPGPTPYWKVRMLINFFTSSYLDSKHMLFRRLPQIEVVSFHRGKHALLRKRS